METTFEEVSSEFVLCARYGELKDMQDMLVQLCEHWSASMARDENLEAFKQEQLSTFLNARASLGGGNTALHMAAANGHLDICKFLIQDSNNKGCINIDQRNNEGNTPLHWAAMNRRSEIVTYLLDQGSNQAIINEFGYTAAMEAQRLNHDEILEIFLRHSDSQGAPSSPPPPPPMPSSSSPSLSPSSLASSSLSSPSSSSS